MSASDGLTIEEAIGFLKDQLHIEKAESLIQNERLEFLNVVCRALHHHSPFQNLCLLAEPVEQRHRPSWQEIKSRMTSKQGGLCYTRNIFTYHLMKALGYTVKVAIARVSGPTDTKPPIYDHVITVALDVCRTGDRYLVENGFGFPCFEAIDLDFKQESKTFRQSHLVFKYAKRDDGIIRMHRKGKDGEFYKYYDFKMELLEPRQVEKYFDIVYTNPDSVSFHRNIHLVRYNNNKAVAIKNFELLVENDEHEFDVITFGSPSDVGVAIRQHFPLIPRDIVEKALANWQLSNKVH